MLLIFQRLKSLEKELKERRMARSALDMIGSNSGKFPNAKNSAKGVFLTLLS